MGTIISRKTSATGWNVLRGCTQPLRGSTRLGGPGPGPGPGVALLLALDLALILAAMSISETLQKRLSSSCTATSSLPVSYPMLRLESVLRQAPVLPLGTGDVLGDQCVDLIENGWEEVVVEDDLRPGRFERPAMYMSP